MDIPTGIETRAIGSWWQRLWGLLLIAGLSVTVGCTFSFEVTSQRTALENQVLGTYKQLDDDMILAASVRSDVAAIPGADTPPPSLKERALAARQNQDFNRDDIEEMKARGVLGEGIDGRLKLLPAPPRPSDIDAGYLALAEKLVREENADREVIWQQVIHTNENLSRQNLPEVRRSARDLLFEKAPRGHWFEQTSGEWRQK